MKSIMLTGCLCVMLTGVTEGWCMHELNDEDLEQISAGTLTASVSDGQFSFRLGDKSSRLSVEGSGSVAVADNTTPAGPAGYIILRDNAQSGLRSLVNVNAVNSRIQVLINLIVNINSTVNSVHQTNIVPGI